MATIAQIVEATARSFGITPERLLKEEGRQHERQIVRYLAYELTQETAGKIAIETGHVTRQAVIYATRQIAHALKKDEALQTQVAAIRRELDVATEGSSAPPPTQELGFAAKP